MNVLVVDTLRKYAMHHVSSRTSRTATWPGDAHRMLELDPTFDAPFQHCFYQVRLCVLDGSVQL